MERCYWQVRAVSQGDAADEAVLTEIKALEAMIALELRFVFPVDLAPPWHRKAAAGHFVPR